MWVKTLQTNDLLHILFICCICSKNICYFRFELYTTCSSEVIGRMFRFDSKRMLSCETFHWAWNQNNDQPKTMKTLKNNFLVYFFPLSGIEKIFRCWEKWFQIIFLICSYSNFKRLYSKKDCVRLRNH